MTTYNFLISRIFTLPLNTEQQISEWMQILHNAHSNNIHKNMLTQLKLKIQRNISQAKPSIQKPPTTVQNGRLSLSRHRKSEKSQNFLTHQHQNRLQMR